MTTRPVLSMKPYFPFCGTTISGSVWPEGDGETAASFVVVDSPDPVAPCRATTCADARAAICEPLAQRADKGRQVNSRNREIASDCDRTCLKRFEVIQSSHRSAYLRALLRRH